MLPISSLAEATVLAKRKDLIRRNQKTGWSLAMMVPSGKVTRTDGTFAPFLGASASTAPKSNSCGHFRGFFALATFALELSTSPYARSE
jgi:hypothetical protein